MKGSIWTLVGQVLPLVASLVAAPFVIRLLGSDGYGLLILIGILPSYFAFADFGMSMASTKFASGAYAAGDCEKEARIVRTCALIAFLTALPISSFLFLFSNSILGLFEVPEHLQVEANVALKITAVLITVNVLNGIVNTPQLSRLRMDLNTLVTSGFRTLGVIATPIVLYLGGGVIGAVMVLAFSALLTLVGHLVISKKLLPNLLRASIDSCMMRSLLTFGGGLVISAIAAGLLVNLEKVVLARVTSVETLAYYSVAFTFATMSTMFASAMTQSLIPAFAQLLGPKNRDQLNGLFSRALRLNFIAILPMLLVMAVFARPFFATWAGEDFGRESTLPFYILLVGVFLNILAHIPYSLLMASGRTDVFAKAYWIELVPYIILVAFLTERFGAVGAALAWSIRIGTDAILVAYFLRKTIPISFNIFGDQRVFSAGVILVLFLPIFVSSMTNDFQFWALLLIFLSIPLYAVGVWKSLLGLEEKTWLIAKLNSALK